MIDELHIPEGGMMPSFEIMSYFQDYLRLTRLWQFESIHFQKTAEAWLGNMDANRDAIEGILRRT